MSGLVQAVLALLAALLPNITSSGVVQQIINTLIQLIPLIVKEISDVYPMIKNIISALSADPATTEEQLAQLRTLDSQVDAAFESAAAAAQIEDDAANGQ